MRDLLVSRGQDFAAAKRPRGIRAASTSAQEVVRIVMMQSFARHICAFQEHVRLGVVSPYPLYQELRQLVAEFSTFSEDTRSEEHPYDLPSLIRLQYADYSLQTTK